MPEDALCLLQDKGLFGGIIWHAMGKTGADFSRGLPYPILFL